MSERRPVLRIRAIGREDCSTGRARAEEMGSHFKGRMVLRPDLPARLPVLQGSLCINPTADGDRHCIDIHLPCLEILASDPGRKCSPAPMAIEVPRIVAVAGPRHAHVGRDPGDPDPPDRGGELDWMECTANVPRCHCSPGRPGRALRGSASPCRIGSWLARSCIRHEQGWYRSCHGSQP